MFKWIAIAAGLLALVSGALTFWLPIPIGLPLMALGLALLMRHSPLFARRLQVRFRRHPRIRRFLQRLGGRVTDTP